MWLGLALVYFAFTHRRVHCFFLVVSTTIGLKLVDFAAKVFVNALVIFEDWSFVAFTFQFYNEPAIVIVSFMGHSEFSGCMWGT